MKFKVGDLVIRTTADYGSGVKKGQVYEVDAINTSNPYNYAAGYGIRIKGFTKANLNPNYFELHKESKVLEILREWKRNSK